MDKRVTAVIVLGAVVASAGGGWIAGRRIASPAEIAARTAPPPPSAILVPVEERVLHTDVVTRGTGRFGSPQKLTVAATAMKTSPGIVSDIALAGTQLREGDVALTASGRPVFVLVGARPVARDLAPGLSGEDVRQLEAALARLGFDPGPADGVYDERTESAVSQLYERAGFRALNATPEQAAQARTREVELLAARAEYDAAQNAQVAASSSIDAARAALDAATARASAAPAALDRARALAAASMRAANAEVAAARAALDALRATTPPPSASALAAAERDLAVALSALQTAELNGARDVADAELTIAAAEREVRAQSAALAAAERSRTTAESTIASRARLAQLAQDEVDRARLRLGVQVPADELIFVANAPIRISEVLLTKGDHATGTAMTVTDTVVSIDGGLAVNDAALVKAGMPVRIEEPDLGIATTGVVRRVATTPGTNGVDGFHVFFEVAVDTAPPTLPGASVRLSIAVGSSGGPVIAVPVSALSLAADGSSRVQRQRAGTTEFVTVVPGIAAAGYVAVSGPLDKSDLVVVGADQKQTPGA